MFAELELHKSRH